MHKSNFVAIIKCNGEVLREREHGCTYLPFGSEYSIVLKNLEKRRVSVKIFIDGQNIFGDNGSYILDGHKEREIERFVGDNLTSGNRFKFIKKTSEISQHRGGRVDDGLISVEFAFEKQVVVQDYVIHNTYIHSDPPYYPSHYCSGACWKCKRPFCGFPWPVTVGSPSFGQPPVQDYSVSVNSIGDSDTTISASSAYRVSNIENYSSRAVSSNAVPVPSPDEGVTVKGSVSSQTFTHASVGELEPASHTMTFQLKGYWPKVQVEVKKPVTTHEKLVCSSCGLSSGTDATYCKRCGTYLVSSL